VKHKVFYSFHYEQDKTRARQIQNMGTVNGNIPIADNAWKKIAKQGDSIIKKWIDDQLNNKTAAIVLIGEKTSERKWVQYEIESAWKKKKGIVGIFVHNLKDEEGNQSKRGNNPFDLININGNQLSSIVKAYEPPYLSSAFTYDHINEKLPLWIEKALETRSEYE